jgi:light-regulated signal transduction histidine kinase (bacteriophytochrome)
MSCIHPDDRSIVEKQIQSYVDPSGLGHFETVYRIITWKGSEVRYVYAQGQMFYEGEGAQRRSVRAVGTVQDITALKRGEQALIRANLELEQFAYAAAHDLQEPLRNVGLATQMLESRYKGKFDKNADSLLKVAVEGPVRMQAMVKDLLAYSRAVVMDEGTVLKADPNAVLQISLKNLAMAIEEKQAVITSDRLPHVRMSELHLTQILQNLIGNSLKYSGPETPRIHVGTDKRSGESIIYVRDNGIGIAPQHHERAFGVFKRLHTREIPGTGIGLSLCKRIVEHYGGKIWIESKEGHGTTLLFTVPTVD